MRGICNEVVIVCMRKVKEHTLLLIFKTFRVLDALDNELNNFIVSLIC